MKQVTPRFFQRFLCILLSCFLLLGTDTAVLAAQPTDTSSVAQTEAAISSLKAVSGSYNSVKLTWTPTASVSGYNLYRSQSSKGGFQKIATLDAAQTSYTDKKLTMGRTYYYRMETFQTGSAGTITSAPSKQVKAIPVLTQPEARISLVNQTTTRIKWKKVSGANGYVLYRSTSKKSGYKKIATIKKGTSITYTDKELTTGKTYYYKLKAYRTVKKKKVYSSYSSPVKIKATLKAPSVKSVTGTNYNTLTVRWNKVSGADGYTIYRSTKENGSYKKIATINGESTLTYKNTGLTTGKTYYYKISAYQKVGSKTVAGDTSKVLSKATSLSKVSKPTATPQHANKIKLEWKKVNGASSYNIYRSTSKNGTYKLIKKGVKKTTYTDSKLTGGKRYYYKIAAKRGSVESKLSSYVYANAGTLTVSQTSVTVQKRFSVTVSAKASPKATVKWSSSNPNIAKVSSKGVIKGVNVGAATIYAKANGITRSVKVQVRQTLDGIDVSKWQGDIDFKKVKKAGYNFVMIRIYNGIEKDPYFETNYKNATDAGLGVGVYYYSYATSAAQAKADAKTVLSILDDRALNYPVVIDMEDPIQLNGLTNTDRTDIAWAFCDTIRANGYSTSLYSNITWLNNYFENDRLKNMNIWIAHWQDSSLGHGYTGNGNIFMWQYSSTGAVDGINGNVDLNLGFSD